MYAHGEMNIFSNDGLENHEDLLLASHLVPLLVAPTRPPFKGTYGYPERLLAITQPLLLSCVMVTAGATSVTSAIFCASILEQCSSSVGTILVGGLVVVAVDWLRLVDVDAPVLTQVVNSLAAGA